MKRTAFDVLRRGFDNLLANWPLIIIRVAEGVLLVGIVVASVVAAIIPVVVAAGMAKNFDPANANNPSELLAMLVIEHWLLLLYIVGLITVILGVLIAIRSFVEAGSAQIYIDGERLAARKGAAAVRTDFTAFAVDRWMAGGRAGWWRVFWIYNLAWSVGGLILLVPLILTLAAMFAVREAGPRIAFGCAGLALVVLLLIPTAIVVGMWTQKAIVICVARGAGAAHALREAWSAIRLDFGRHFAVALILMVVSFVAAMAVSGLSFPMSFGSHRGLPFLPLIFAPAQIALSFVQSALSAAIGAWFLASFVALTEER